MMNEAGNFILPFAGGLSGVAYQRILDLCDSRSYILRCRGDHAGPTKDTLMSDTLSLSLSLIGAQLHAIQAQQRTLRGENELIRKELGRMAGAMVSRDTLSEVLTVLVDRIANFEALIEARFDGLTAQISRLVPQ